MKNILALILVTGALTIFGAGLGFAADGPPATSDTPPAAATTAAPTMPDEAAMKKMMEYTAPGEMHKMLGSLAGKWAYTSKMWMTPDAPAQESKGTSKNTMIYGGRYLEQKVNGSMKMGAKTAPFEGVALTGFDNIKQEFNTIWYDNMSTAMMFTKGPYDAGSKIITETGDMSCPMKGKPVAMRSETKFIDAKSYSFTMYMMDDSGKEFKTMEIEYKRVK